MVAVIKIGHRDIHFYKMEKLGRSEEFRFLQQGADIHTEFRDTTFPNGPRFGTPSWDNPCILAKDEDKIVGAMTYSINEWLQIGNINYAHVDQAYRRNGIHSKMLELAMIDLASMGCRTLVRTVNVNNTTMRAAIEKQGGIPIVVEYTQHIPARYHVKPKQL